MNDRPAIVGRRWDAQKWQFVGMRVVSHHKLRPGLLAVLDRSVLLLEQRPRKPRLPDDGLQRADSQLAMGSTGTVLVLPSLRFCMTTWLPHCLT